MPPGPLAVPGDWQRNGRPRAAMALRAIDRTYPAPQYLVSTLRNTTGPASDERLGFAAYWQARGFQLYVFSGRISLSVSFHLLLLALRGHLPPAGCLLA